METMRGFHLIELIIIMSILAVVVMFSIPSYHDWVSQSRLNSDMHGFARLIMTGRDQAVYHNQIVTICPSANGQTCLRQWHQGAMAFVDRNDNQNIDPGENHLGFVETSSPELIVEWRAFRRRSYLQMRPEGFTAFQNGTLVFCPKEGVRKARALILNRMGRIRWSLDSDNDGLHENGSGRPLTCP